VRRFHGVGPRTAEKMAKLGLVTGADIAAKDELWLTRHFGSWGSYLHKAARGIDDRPVNANSIRKSLGGELTYFEDKRSEDELREALDEIIDIVWDRIERYRAQGRTITLKARYSDFRTITRSRSIPHILTERTEFAGIGHALLDAILPSHLGIRLLGLTLSNLVSDEAVQDNATGQESFSFDTLEE
jgi:DNA polymerase IV